MYAYYMGVETKEERKGEKRREKKVEVQSTHPGQSSLKIYSNLIKKSLDFLKLYWSHLLSENLN